MNILLKPLLISCRESTRLSERKLLIGLTLLEKIRLRLHQRLCAVCKNYEDQSRIIDKALQQENAPLLYRIDPETKERILTKIKTKN